MKSILSKFLLAAFLLSNLWTVAPVSAAPLCSASHSQAINQELIWGPQFDFEVAEKTLRTQKTFRKIIPMREYLQSLGKEPSGTSEVYYVEFENQLKVVWKPDEDIYGPGAEEATYVVARRLGIKTFVPTIVTEIGGRTGSLSVYVETPQDLVAMKESQRNEIFARIPEEQWADMDTAHFLLGQWDRHAGNLLVDEANSLVVIDNEGVSQLSVWQLGSYPFVRFANLPKNLRTGDDEKRSRRFTYDQVQYLNGNDPAALGTFFELYKIKPERLPLKQFERYQDQKLPFVIWRDALWRPRGAKSLPPIKLSTLSKSTLERLQKLTEEDLRALLNPSIFTDFHIELIMERKKQILEQAAKARILTEQKTGQDKSSK